MPVRAPDRRTALYLYKAIHSPIASLSPLSHLHWDLRLCCYSGIAQVLVVGEEATVGCKSFQFFFLNLRKRRMTNFLNSSLILSLPRMNVAATITAQEEEGVGAG
jgi:hypothetical protein